MAYYILISLPFLIFFIRLFLTNYFIPYINSKSLRQTIEKNKDAEWIKTTENHIKRIFKGAHTKMLSKIYRARKRISNKDFVYGEIHILSFYILLKKTNPKPHDIFYDLGSGAGLAVFTAAFFFDISKSNGIELLEPLYQQACSRLKQAQTLYTGTHPCTKKTAVIHFHQNDFLTHDFSDANIIYIAATCLSDKTWQSLIQKMAQLKQGTRIIVATKSIHHPNFELIHHGIELMSWGLCAVSIYQIRNVTD